MAAANAVYPRGVENLATLPAVTVDEVRTRIDAEAAAAPPGRGVVATDGDGTLWSGDIGEDYFGALLASGRIRGGVRDALAREAAEFGIDAGGTAEELARRLDVAHVAGAYPEERAYELMAWAFAGWTEAEASGFAEEVLRDVGLRDRLHAEAIAVIDHARAQGIEVFLVSASPRAVVTAAARIVGIDPARVCASTPASASGVLQPRAERPIPYGPGKVKHLRAAVGDRTIYAAMGDNVFDLEMLASARVPLAIRPKDRLLARAGDVPGLAVVAR